MPVASIVFVVIIDGLAIYGSGLLAFQAGGLFSRTVKIHRYDCSAARDRAYAWHLLAVIGLIAAVASVFTGWVLHAGDMMVWPAVIAVTLLVVGMTAGREADKWADRLE